ncbi:MAG: chemotaxis protein CheX [Candidatus Schekmanbacteria bacterium]|nr:chemotaxis protein CheX [Candidatus Schekmanbacteria bacterium]
MTALEDWFADAAAAASDMSEMLTGLPLTPLAAASGQNVTVEVSALIGFTGDVGGALVISTCKTSAAALAEMLLGESFDADAAEVLDAVGEYCNMVAGDLRRRMGEHGIACDMTVPSLITGRAHEIHHSNRSWPVRREDLAAAWGRLRLELAMGRAES